MYNHIQILVHQIVIISLYLKEEMKRMGYKTVPQIWNHRGEHIGGYDDLVRYFERTILSETK